MDSLGESFDSVEDVEMLDEVAGSLVNAKDVNMLEEMIQRDREAGDGDGDVEPLVLVSRLKSNPTAPEMSVKLDTLQQLLEVYAWQQNLVFSPPCLDRGAALAFSCHAEVSRWASNHLISATSPG